MCSTQILRWRPGLVSRPAAHTTPPWGPIPLRVAPLLFFDVESTGLHPDRGARLTEWAVVDHSGLCVHETLAPEADGYDAALAERLSRLFGVLCDGIVVGHHLSFDLGFVAREADRLGLAGPRLRYIDTLGLARRLLNQAADFQLGTLLSHFDVSPEAELHTAPGDAWATQALFWALVEQGGLDTPSDAGVKALDWTSF